MINFLKKNKKEILSWIQVIFWALIIVIPFKYFISEPYLVIGPSMEPNFKTGDYLFINKISDEFNRGDIIVFVPPHERSDSWLKYTVFFDNRDKYIKRIVGLPGEILKIENGELFLKKNNNEFIKINEPYIKNKGGNVNKIFYLKSDEYLVFGDNRANSSDSRTWGPIKKDDILGKPFLRLFPINKIDLNPGLYPK